MFPIAVKKLRPFHPHRWLAEIYEKEQKWQYRFLDDALCTWEWYDCYSNSAVADMCGAKDFKWREPRWQKGAEYRPHPDETELFKFYEENKNEH